VGWFQLPAANNPRFLLYLATLPAPWNTYDGFKAGFVAGVIPEQYLDKVPDVLELRNQEIEALVGQTCVAVVYDSDISSVNYNPLSASLKGERYGLFTFKILAVETPGSLNGDPYPNVLDESKSSDSLYDVWLEVLDPLADPLSCVTGQFFPRQDPPDSCSITRARQNNGTITVIATSDFAPDAILTFTVDGSDKGSLHTVDPIFLEAPLPFWKDDKYRAFEVAIPGGANLKGRRISVQSNEGCVYNSKVARPN
jgi:hypothetical protein